MVHFSDLEWYNQRYHLNAPAASTTGSNTTTLDDHRTLDTDQSPPDGLESDEVAELVYLHFNLWAGIQNTGDVDTEPGMAEVRVGFGINTSEDEFSTKTPDTDVTNSAEDSSFTDSGAVSIGGPTDEPGMLWDQYGTLAWPGLDTTNGAGAGAGPAGFTDQHVINFRQQGMVGPVIDASDDWNAHAYIDKRQLSNAVRAGWQVRAGYLVHEVADARKAFAMP